MAKKRKDVVSFFRRNSLTTLDEIWSKKSFAVCVALIIRFSIGLGSYSGKPLHLNHLYDSIGAQTSPTYGDFEAQRHWMEVTIHLPIKEWYRASEVNDLSHWGLDYPPLSGYQSWIHGKIVQKFEPEAVELVASHGYETSTSKLLLRWCVIGSDVLVYFPAALLAATVIGNETFVMLLLQPCLVLIDHGHYQFNCISLGCVLLAILCILKDHHLLGSVFFVCAFNHKHMSLYFAFAFFGHLFGHCLNQPIVLQKLRKFVFLGSVVVGTMIVIWTPFLKEPGYAWNVVQRLTPVSRGLYEDYVSNFWCVSSVLFRWKKHMDQNTLFFLCAASTFVASLPSLFQQIQNPTKIGFLYSLANISLVFYLFSFQVHEKSILMPALAISLLFQNDPCFVACFHLVASFSLFPLLEKDNLVLQYIAIQLLFISIIFPSFKNKKQWQIALFMSIGMGLHLLRVCITPPKPFPFFHDLLFSTASFVYFFGSLLYLNYRQWSSNNGH